jgi:hypothetical protein
VGARWHHTEARKVFDAAGKQEDGGQGARQRTRPCMQLPACWAWRAASISSAGSASGDTWSALTDDERTIAEPETVARDDAQ